MSRPRFADSDLRSGSEAARRKASESRPCSAAFRCKTGHPSPALHARGRALALPSEELGGLSWFAAGAGC